MRRIIFPFLFPAVAAVLAFGQPVSGSPPAHHQLTASQTRRIAQLVARHDNIDLSDTHIEFNSMDTGAAFVPGFSSFIVIRESTTPGPDETLRRYAVSRRTGDVWEINLCTHYAFPELARMQVAMAGHPGDEAGQIAEQGRQLGCSEQKSAPAS
jgi:hypothetical protein